MQVVARKGPARAKKRESKWRSEFMFSRAADISLDI